jgi:hypothetical protein
VQRGCGTMCWRSAKEVCEMFVNLVAYHGLFAVPSPQESDDYAQDRDSWRTRVKCGNEHSGSIKCWAFLD